MKFTIKLQGKPLVHGLWEKINVTLPLEKIYKQEAELLNRLEPNVYYSVEIKEKPKRKTLSQNAYAWSLLKDIGESTKISPMELYKSKVRLTTHYKILRLKIEDYEGFNKGWEHNGDGWFCEVIRDAGEWRELRAYYGMSIWTKDDMSVFIEDLIDECRELGVVPRDRSEVYGRLD